MNMSENGKVEWTTEKIKLGDLVDWEKNPVSLSEHDFEQIKTSIEKFGLVMPLVANQPPRKGAKCRLIDGHQRKTILTYSKMAEATTILDVRIPSRKLTERECDELSIRLRRNTGEWDFDKLANEFDVGDLLDWGFVEKDLQLDGFGMNVEKDIDDEIYEQFMILIDCETEEQQIELLSKFEKEGLKCRALIS